MSKPILCLDFDGVLHAYTSGWDGVASIPDGPVPGAVAFLAKAVEYFDVHVHSSRSSCIEGITAMSSHLLTWCIDELGREAGYMLWTKIICPTGKPPAMVTLDDRAITFTGRWPDPQALLHFQPWNKRKESTMERYAKDELARLRNPTDEPDEMQDAIEACVLGIVQQFADAGHSGSSGAYTLGILTKVLAFEPVTPLTGAEDEWVELGYNDDMLFQNKRCPHVFKRADDVAYDSNAVVHRDPSGACYTGSFSRRYISFPYTPKVEYVDVDEKGEPLFKPILAESTYAPLPKIIEASEPMDGVHDWALTCEWSDGSETVEFVSTNGAKAMGYVPPGGWDGEGDTQDANVEVPRIFKDGDQWCCLLGADLATGVAGFGDTPADACCQFGERWLVIKDKERKNAEFGGATGFSYNPNTRTMTLPPVKAITLINPEDEVASK